MFQASDSARLLNFGFYKNPRLQTGYVLAQMLKDKWLDFFCHGGKLSGANLLQSGMAIENPMTRSPKTLYLTWNYEK